MALVSARSQSMRMLMSVITSETAIQMGVYSSRRERLRTSQRTAPTMQALPTIARIRVDDDGTHWIVDYKTSTHEGGNLDRFLDQESERHLPQLEKYAALYAAVSGAPVRVALYFPLLQEFRELALK